MFLFKSYHLLTNITSENGDEEDQSLAPRFLKTAIGQLEVTEGDSARINCRVSGRPPPDIQWYLNGQRLIQDDRHKVIVNEAGSHSLLITKTILSDTGSIACVATNRSGEAAFQVGLS